MKKQSLQRFIYKIHSSRFRNNNWNLNISIPEAKRNGEIIAVGENEVIRFIDKRNGTNIEQLIETINQIKKENKKLKKDKTNLENRKKIKENYKKLDDLLFIEDYVCIIMDKNKDYDKAVRGLFINGVRFKRLLATTGGAKQKTVVFVSEAIKDDLEAKIDNGRNKDKEFVAGKLESYKSLVFSASEVPITQPKGILVVKDCFTQFLSDVITINDTRSEYPRLRHIKNYLNNPNVTDGFGLILPQLSKQWTNELSGDYIASNLIIRNSFCKGNLVTFDFIDFGRKIAKNMVVVDAWGKSVDLIKDNIEIVLTTSMLKLWDSYSSMEDYINNCRKNDYKFSVTKIAPKELENERNLNYQFIQSLDLNDEDIDELIKPTVDLFKDILGGDWRKTILFLKGLHLHDESFIKSDNDFIKAIMIDNNIVNDPFVRKKINEMLKKRINMAKTGVLKVNGNFSTTSGDPYILCESMFGLKPKGLLKKGEFYSHYWNSRGVSEVAAFRAPMSNHNNIRKLRFKNTEEMQYWYQYMKTVTIFNAWDNTSDAMNGLDHDGDQILTTDMPILLRSIEELEPIVCKQQQAKKIHVSEADLIKANKNSFGDEIGKITNRITSFFDIRSQFPKDSKEYETLTYRIQCGQNYQQNAIDKTKGIQSKSMPKEWYSYKENIVAEGDNEKTIRKKEFNRRIVANKKPYFFNYIYPERMKDFNTYKDNVDRKCIRKYKLTLEELKKKKYKTEEEEKFLEDYKKYAPCSLNDSIINKICWKIEKEFDRKSTIKTNKQKFDYKILMSGNESKYSLSRYVAIKQLFAEYQNRIKEFNQLSKNERIDEDEVNNQRQIFKNEFKQRAEIICNNAEELCDIVIDLCYKKNTFEQFAWDICGEQIIENLLNKNSRMIHYPIQDENGEIEFAGKRFTLVQKQLVNEGEYYESYFE